MLPLAHPDDPPTFIINPRGWRFEELTASGLIVCDLDGRVLRGTGELRKVAFHIHARIHLRNPAAACVLHVHPQYLTALSMLENPELALSHHNNLVLNDRVVVDTQGDAPVADTSEGDRIADLMGDKTIMIMASHGVTVVGPTVHDAFDELFSAERTVMYQMTAMATGQKLRRLPERLRRGYTGPWSGRADARMHLDAWRRILDKEEPDYAT
jgi:ribulose-5-phosphate 4-epimerase/fuculose-1-phosphate aldolase